MDAAKQEARRQHAMSPLSATLRGEGLAFVRASEQLPTEPEVQGTLYVPAKELETVNAYLTRISEAESMAGQQLEDLRQRLEARQQQGDMAPLLDFRLQLRQGQLQMIRATLDDINLHIGYLQLQQRLGSGRLDLHQSWDFAKAKGQLEQIATLLGPIEEGISGPGAVPSRADGRTDLIGLDPGPAPGRDHFSGSQNWFGSAWTGHRCSTERRSRSSFWEIAGRGPRRSLRSVGPGLHGQSDGQPERP